MPPSGFNQKAINGLLEFVRANYQTALSEYRANGDSEIESLEASAENLANRVRDASQGFAESEGLVTFMTECYKDLVLEIQQGEDKYQRPVVNGQAIEKELGQIKAYLTEFKL